VCMPSGRRPGVAALEPRSRSCLQLKRLLEEAQQLVSAARSTSTEHVVAMQPEPLTQFVLFRWLECRVR
jgi:hypothetical protein